MNTHRQVDVSKIIAPCLWKMAILGAIFLSELSFGEILIIAHPETQIGSLSESEVKQIYLGKISSHSGTKLIPLDQLEGESTRTTFYETIVIKTEAQLKAYWSRLIFTGKSQPPQALGSDEDILTMVKTNPNLIGYIDSQFLKEGVKVLFRK